MASSSSLSKYEIWEAEPGSVRERRQRLLREMGLSNDRELQREPLDVHSGQQDLRQRELSEIQPSPECSSSGSHSTDRLERSVLRDAGIRMGRASPGDIGRSISCDELSQRSMERPASWSIVRSRSDGATSDTQHAESSKCTTSPLIASRGIVNERLVDNPRDVLRSREPNQLATSSTKPPSGKTSNAATNGKDLPQLQHVGNGKPSQEIGFSQKKSNSCCSGDQAGSLGNTSDGGFRNTNSQITASFTANGKYVVSASEDSYVYIWNYDNPSNPAARNQVICRSYEHFLSRSVSAAIPWPGLNPETLSSRHNLELSLRGILNAGRKIGSLPQASVGGRDSDTSLYDAAHGSISRNSQTQCDAVERNGKILEGAGVRDICKGLVPENDRVSVVGAIGADASGISDCISGSFQAGSTTASVSQRIPDHLNLNHVFFPESLSRGSATWPEEKLLPFSRQITSKVAISELPNNICETCDGGTLQDQSTAAAWGLVIVTAGLGGEIRTFQNYGLPVRL